MYYAYISTRRHDPIWWLWPEQLHSSNFVSAFFFFSFLLFSILITFSVRLSEPILFYTLHLKTKTTLNWIITFLNSVYCLLAVNIWSWVVYTPSYVEFGLLDLFAFGCTVVVAGSWICFNVMNETLLRCCCCCCCTWFAGNRDVNIKKICL